MDTRTLRPSFPIDLGLTLAPLQRGAHDPCTRVLPHEAWRATRTPDGPATVRYARAGDGIDVTAWGPGAGWALRAAPALLGFDDDPAALEPRNDLVRDLQRRFAGLLMGRTGAVIEALVASIIEQKVAGMEAWASWEGMVRALGERAPGETALLLPPSPERLAATPYWDFHRFGIERRRAEAIVRAAGRASRLEEAAAMPSPEARRRLTAIEGVGVWTAAEVARTALGDPDAVSVGDFHTKHMVAWAFAGEPRGTDERMLGLLEPYRGQRGRVVRLLEAGGVRAPRYGPRQRLRSIAKL